MGAKTPLAPAAPSPENDDMCLLLVSKFYVKFVEKYYKYGYICTYQIEMTPA